MEKIYIIGHRNPDFDSVCSAYAYAELKNRIDPSNKYIAARCGHLPESMKKVFANLGITPPVYIRDIYPKHVLLRYRICFCLWLNMSHIIVY